MVRGEEMLKYFKYWFKELKTVYMIEALVYAVFTIWPLFIDSRVSAILNSLIFAIIVYTNVLFDIIGLDGMFTSKKGGLLNSVPISSARLIMYKTVWMLVVQVITFAIGFIVSFTLWKFCQDNSIISLFTLVAATSAILFIIAYGMGSIANIIALRLRCRTRNKLVEGIVTLMSSLGIVTALFQVSLLVSKAGFLVELTGGASGFGFKIHSTPTSMAVFISMMVIVIVVLINVFGKTIDKKLDIL